MKEVWENIKGWKGYQVSIYIKRGYAIRGLHYKLEEKTI
jgi:hypothetical protein